MDKNLHHIEELFKSALDDNEAMPSAKVWNAVDNRLDKESIATIEKKYKSAKRLLLLLLLLLSGLGWYQLNSHFNKSSIAEKNNNAGVPIKTGTENTVETEQNKDPLLHTAPALPSSVQSNTAPTTHLSQAPQNNIIKEVLSVTPSTLVADKGFTKIKIKNGSASQEEPSVIENNTEQANTQEPVLQQLSAPVFEKIPLQKTGSIASKTTIAPLRLSDIPTALDAANSTKKKAAFNKASRFSVTGFFSPDIATYSLNNDNTGNQPDNAVKIKGNERHEFSSTLGVLVDYDLNKRWALQLGITFSNTNIAIDPKTIYAQADNTGSIKYRLNFSSGYGYLVPSFQPNPAVGDSLNVTGTAHKLRYIGVPIAVKYRIIKGKFIIEAMAGISTNFLTMGKLETEIQKGPNNELDVLNKIEGLKPVYLSGLAGIGINYKLNNKLSFVLMPTTRFALNAINKNAVVKTFSNSTGLAAGLKWHF
jgi:hypothetical protein